MVARSLARPLSMGEVAGGAGTLASKAGAWWRVYTPKASSDLDIQYIVPIEDGSINSVWHGTEATAGGTIGTYYKGVNDGPGRQDGTNRISTTGAGNGAGLVLRLSPIARPASGDIVFHMWANGAAAETSSIVDFEIFQASAGGETIRYTVTHSLSATTAYTDYVCSLDASVQRLVEASASNGFQNLWVRVKKANSGNVKIASIWGQAPGANVRNMLVPDNVWHTGSASVNMSNPEIDQNGYAVCWTEGTDLLGYVDTLSPGASLNTGGTGKGLSVGTVLQKGTPQMGDRKTGPYGVWLDGNGYFLTCDINRVNPALSSLHTWSTGDPDDATERGKRTLPFGLKNTDTNEHIITYRYDATDGTMLLRAINLDRGWGTAVTLDSQIPAPTGRIDALAYNTPRAMPGTWKFYGGYYASAGVLAECQIRVFDLVNASLNSATIYPATSGSFHHGGVSVFINDINGKEAFCCSRNTVGGTGVVVYQASQTTTVFDVEGTYVLSSLSEWLPEFVSPGGAQSVESVGDGNGRNYLFYSLQDNSQALSAFSVSSPAVICAAVVGTLDSVSVISRRSTWAPQFEPEPFKRGGTVYCNYETMRDGRHLVFSGLDQGGRIMEMPSVPDYLARLAAVRTAYAFNPLTSTRFAIPTGSLMVRIRTNSDLYFAIGDSTVVASPDSTYVPNGSEDFNIPTTATHIALRAVQTPDVPTLTWDTSYRTY